MKNHTRGHYADVLYVETTSRDSYRCEVRSCYSVFTTIILEVLWTCWFAEFSCSVERIMS